MDSLEPRIAEIINSFPDQFEFYHLGRVELQGFQQAKKDCLQKNNAIAFRIEYDVSVWIVVLFGRDLDIPTYSELGNIIVSKMVTQLSSLLGAEIMISPPHYLDQTQIEIMAQTSYKIICKNYSHHFKNSVIPIETWILPSLWEGIGNA